ncbi:MAG: NAD(P)H-dependent oxidoreductase subunit E [Gammaproteobacteria bacterium]|nr:NAD(P)H-dependent oxidoreductase subunit E [Gammaproteobacteria bacterium]MDH3856489.1 NAD(P)H-dependent oxidoreductase subunit E [Gammaproteobacteria bacterium]
MSQPEPNSDPVDNRKQRRRGKTKGRVVDLNALLEVQSLLGDESRARDLLIEHLHKIQDNYGHLSAAHLVALAHEMRLATTEVYEVASFYHHFDVIREGDIAPPSLTVRVCDSVSCEMAGSESLIAALESSLGDGVRVQRVPCVGRCDKAPVAVVGQYTVDNATDDAVKSAVDAGNTTQSMPDDSIDFDAYRASGGYQLFDRLLGGDISGDTIIEALEGTQLRGLGGAGFPVGRKWGILRDQPAPRLCAINIDEGEPGTFKDRFYMLSDPHRFLEGMLIAARVIGINACYIYIRDEYPSVIQILKLAVDDLVKKSGYELPLIEIRRGAGAYICGEESAMIESIEGKRGMPRLRPPYVAEVGLFGRPTLEHNCESLFWIRDIIEKGSEWFDSQGRNGRKGVRSFSVSGRVNKPGVHLAPAGITIKELIDEYCGGMLDGHQFYGYFPGGASGGILPASLNDIPLDFDTLQEYGCFIGSAAVVVLSDQDSAKQAALNSLKFFAHESCGQCTPCRVGCEKAVSIMETGNWDIEQLNDLSTVMVDASICGLGQAAPNPILSVIKYFPHELGIEENP